MHRVGRWSVPWVLMADNRALSPRNMTQWRRWRTMRDGSSPVVGPSPLDRAAEQADTQHLRVLIGHSRAKIEPAATNSPSSEPNPAPGNSFRPLKRVPACSNHRIFGPSGSRFGVISTGLCLFRQTACPQGAQSHLVRSQNRGCQPLGYPPTQNQAREVFVARTDTHLRNPF